MKSFLEIAEPFFKLIRRQQVGQQVFCGRWRLRLDFTTFVWDRLGVAAIYAGRRQARGRPIDRRSGMLCAVYLSGAHWLTRSLLRYLLVGTESRNRRHNRPRRAWVDRRCKR